MNKTQEAINFLNDVSNDLHNQSPINVIKQNISNAANVIDTVQYSRDNNQITILDEIVNECILSLHNIMKKSIDQQTEDLYADLSANIYCIHEQVERIKNS